MMMGDRRGWSDEVTSLPQELSEFWRIWFDLSSHCHKNPRRFFLIVTDGVVMLVFTLGIQSMAIVVLDIAMFPLAIRCFDPYRLARFGMPSEWLIKGMWVYVLKTFTPGWRDSLFPVAESHSWEERVWGGYG